MLTLKQRLLQSWNLVEFDICSLRQDVKIICVHDLQLFISDPVQYRYDRFCLNGVLKVRTIIMFIPVIRDYNVGRNKSKSGHMLVQHSTDDQGRHTTDLYGYKYK